jgi:hypothetical protein
VLVHPAANTVAAAATAAYREHLTDPSMFATITVESLLAADDGPPHRDPGRLPRPLPVVTNDDHSSGRDRL